MDKFVRFNPDLWQTVFNYDAMAVVTTIDDNHMKVTGSFRTEGDYIGLLFSSEDIGMHSHCQYKTDFDYRRTIWKFSTKIDGVVAPYNDTNLQPSIVAHVTEDKGDKQYFITLGFLGIKNKGSDDFVYNGEIKLSNTWIDWHSVTGKAVWSEGSKELKFGDDYDMDYVNGRFFTTESAGIPPHAKVTINYTYNTHEQYIIDFSKIIQGTHPTSELAIDSSNISRLDIPIIPTYFKQDNLVMTGRSDDFTLEFTDIEVIDGDIGDMFDNMPEHSYRIAEGFDDEYNKNPKRLAETTFALGYRKIVNIYIGASHYYNKFGEAGKESTDYKSMYLDPTTELNPSFVAWMSEYLKHLKRLGFEQVVMSISMENLQMPEEWKQLMYDGQPGGTGWTPPTNFYSPNNAEVKDFISRITKACLDMLVDAGFPPILQLGEPWWWWQEFKLGNVNDPLDGRPPCFYDKGTLERFKEETGQELKVYNRTDVMYEPKEDNAITDKLNQYLCEYSDFMKSIVKKYENGEYCVLFFPPSVLDKGRVPMLMRKVNTPFAAWNNNQLDFIQVEDYDWIVNDNPQHNDVYMFAWDTLGYHYNKQQYFAGFAWDKYNIPVETQWERIEKAAATALARRFKDVFIWAGTQIRRDSWIPKRNFYGTDTEQWLAVNMYDNEKDKK